MRPHDPPLEAWFLGSLGENAPLLEDLVVEALRDHVFWRRNFHPEDGPMVREGDKRNPAYEEAIDRLRQELYRLLAKLKRGTPTFSHRHLGHMVSDVSMAGLIGYLAAMFYNPNNVTPESSPVATSLENEVGRQLATMLGYSPDDSWGHLTSCGTIANLEALWAALTLRYYPLAAALAVRDLGINGPLVTLPDGRILPLITLTLWEALNLTTSATLALAEQVEHWETGLAAATRSQSVGTLGFVRLASRCRDVFGEELVPPVVIVPVTKHYSWIKLPNLLGLGTAQLREVPIDADYRMDLSALRLELAALRQAHTPVLALVGVCGSTEVGAVDDLAGMAALRAEVAALGQSFYFHVDAAYGGYAASLMWNRAGGRRSRSQIAQQVRLLGWPGKSLYEAFLALAEADSVTIDPHKMGYLPYPAGAIVHRDDRVRAQLSTDAPYVFADHDRDMQAATGRSIVEGSRPGAAAAACWLSHQVIPLNETGYGAIIGLTCEGAQRTRQAMLTHNQRQQGSHLLPINTPDLNVQCFVVATPGIRSLAELNALNLALHARFSTISETLVFAYDFLVSQTALDLACYREALQQQVSPQLPALAFDEAFCGSETQVHVLRLALMNPFFAKGNGERDFVEAFITAMHQATGAHAQAAVPAAVH